MWYDLADMPKDLRDAFIRGNKYMYPKHPTPKMKQAMTNMKRRLSRFGKKLPQPLQKTFDNLHDALIKKTLTNYMGQLLENDPNLRNETLLIIIACTSEIINKNPKHSKKLEQIHKIAVTKLMNKPHKKHS